MLKLTMSTLSYNIEESCLFHVTCKKTKKDEVASFILNIEITDREHERY